MTRDANFKTSDKRNLPIFIHSELDDYGLTPIEFRVYARLARRAGKTNDAFESVDKMAKAFGVSGRTIQRALQVLTETHVVTRVVHHRHPNNYELNPQSEWAPKSQLKAIQQSVKARKKGDAGVTPETEATVTPIIAEGDPGDPKRVTADAHQGTPLKVLPEDTPTTRARELPRRKDSEPKPQLYGVELMMTPPETWFAKVERDMRAVFPAVPFEKAWRQWYLSRKRDGVGKRHLRSATLDDYAGDIEIFFSIWDTNHQNSNGYGGNGKDDYRGPVKDTRTPEERERVYECRRCNGTGTELVPGKGAKVCKHEPLPEAIPA